MRAPIFAVVLSVASVSTISIAQDADKPVRRPIPDEHKDFVTEVANVFQKYPETASNYEMISIGGLTFLPASRRCVEVCRVDWQHFDVSCRIECEREQ